MYKIRVLVLGAALALAPAVHAGTEVVGDRVWEDLDGDGRQDAGEPGIAGVDVVVYGDADCDGVVAPQDAGDTEQFRATTAADGSYSIAIDNLPGGGGPGSLECRTIKLDPATLPANHGLTTSNDPLTLTVDDGATYNEADFGLRGNALHIIGHTAFNIVVDHNQFASNVGPEVFHIGAQVCNTSSTTLTNVVAYVGDGTTPGEFPDSTGPGGGKYAGSYELVLLDDWLRGGRMRDGTVVDVSDATRFLGDIAPNTCVGVFWPVVYPLYDPNDPSLPVFGDLNVKADDLDLNFTVWATADGQPTTVLNDFATTRPEQQANPNKIQPSGNPAGFVTVDPSGIVAPGQTVCVTYHNVDFGNVNQGFDANLDGAQDYDLWFQPVGEKAYDPDVLRLIETRANLEATNCGPAAPNNPKVTLLDDTFELNINRFDAQHNSSCNMVGQYTYCFVALSSGTSTINPYQETASGFENEKYNGDYNEDPVCITPTPADDDDPNTPGVQLIPGPTGGCITINSQNVPAIDKTVDKEIVKRANGDSDVLTYTLSFTNTTGAPVGDPESGNHVVFTDTIPKELNPGEPIASDYVAGSASCNAGGLPNGCTVQYSTDDRVTWTATEPADPVTVTDVRFVFNDPIPDGTTVTATFQVDVRDSWTGVLQNLAQVRLDNGPTMDEDDAVTCIDVDQICNTASTAVVVAAFGSHLDGDQVVLTWETAAEIGTVGFYLERRNALTGTYERVNPELLLGLLHAPAGGVYQLVDPGAVAGERYTYRLVEVEASGRENLYGPYTVTAGSGQAPVAGDGAFGALVSDMARARGLSALQQARLAARRAERAKSRGRPARPGAKALVEADGLYFLSAEALAGALDGRGDLVQGNRLRLLSGGRDVAAWPAPDGSGLYFYGRGLDSPYTEGNVYVLRQEPGSRMEAVGGKAPRRAADPDASFMDTVHAERDRMPVLILTDDPDSDYWYWQFVMGQFRYPEPFLAVETPHPAAGRARLTVHVQALTDRPAHRLQVSLNGTVLDLDVDQWSGQAAHSASAEFDAALLDAGGNRVTVSTLTPGSMIYVDSVDIRYPRRYRAVNDRARVRPNGAGVVSVDGFGSDRIWVFDITDPERPKRVTAVTIDNGAVGYRVSFEAPSALSTYLALTPEAARPPRALVPDTPSTLRAPGQGADYVIVAPADFLAAAGRLAEYRRGQGLKVAVVDVEDVYDEFSHGRADPRAIRDFMAYAYAHWQPAPRYLLLAGNGSFDYKDVFGLGDNLLPPLLAPTPHGLFAADNRFGDVTGDGVPEIAVGRLPALAAGELEAVVDKLIAYEADGSPPPERVILAADDPDRGGDFRGDSEALARRIPAAGYDVARVYLSDLPAAAARDALRGALNAGAAIFNYVGHGATDRIGLKDGQSLLTVNDVDALASGTKRPVMLALTCQAGRFDPPGYASLGEVLVMDPDGGTVATWAPTGQSFNDEAHILNQGFFDAVFDRNLRVLGDAVLAALRYHAREGKQPYTLGIYNLLGDPAMRLNMR